MHLPNELIVAILGYLDRSHLKSTRLVCKTWCSYASQFLFDKIYVAPNKIDLEVFEAITQHPILSKCVRRLVYDGSEFLPDLTMCSYVESLGSQTTLMCKTGEASPENWDSQTRDWVADATGCGMSLQEAVAKWEDQSPINRGYQVYQQHSVYQQTALESGEFIESLVQGLSRLVCLEAVALEGGWPSAVQEGLGGHHHGTPLARRWNPFHCCPHKWAWQPEESDIEKIPDGERHYWIITTALVRAERQVDEFVFNGDCLLRWDGISPNFFVPNALGLDIAALSEIKRLHLLLASCRDAEAPEYCDNIGGLPQLLGSMHVLQRLELDVPNTINDLILYNHDQVFPKVTMWNNLGTLGLFNFSSSATDLLRLLLIQMPRLKSLDLGPTQLVEGCWESVIECLRQCHQFTALEIESDCLLYHRGEEFLLCDNADITEYIMHGGRHPCLSEDQPTSASEAYMLRIDAALRDRLLEMKSSRTHLPI